MPDRVPDSAKRPDRVTAGNLPEWGNNLRYQMLLRQLPDNIDPRMLAEIERALAAHPETMRHVQSVGLRELPPGVIGEAVGRDVYLDPAKDHTETGGMDATLAHESVHAQNSAEWGLPYKALATMDQGWRNIMGLAGLDPQLEWQKAGAAEAPAYDAENEMHLRRLALMKQRAGR